MTKTEMDYDPSDLTPSLMEGYYLRFSWLHDLALHSMAYGSLKIMHSSAKERMFIIKAAAQR